MFQLNVTSDAYQKTVRSMQETDTRESEIVNKKSVACRLGERQAGRSVVLSHTPRAHVLLLLHAKREKKGEKTETRPCDLFP